MALNATALTENIYGAVPGSQNALDFGWNYLLNLPGLVMQGDFFGILIALVLGYFLIFLLNKISGLFLIVLKKTIAFIITILALWLIYQEFMANLQIEGLSLNTLFIGLVGILVGIVGTIISFYALFRHTRHAIVHREAVPEDKANIDLNHMKEFKTFFSLDSLKNDKSLLSVLTFLVVAQFGVFSSNTISAPNPQIGMILFGVFMVLSFLFIKQSYHSYARGLMHIGITFVLGVVLAFTLGHYWANIPLEVLFSLQVFETDVIVALISGMALSLFAGSRS